MFQFKKCRSMCHIHHLELGETHRECYTKRFKTIVSTIWVESCSRRIMVRWYIPRSMIFLFASTGIPEEMNLSDVKQIHQTDGGSALGTAGAGCTAATETTALTLMGVVMLFPGLW